MPLLWVGQEKVTWVSGGGGVGWVVGHPRSLTGIPVSVSCQPPDQHLPGHPFHRREQVLRLVSLPKRRYAVGCDPAPRQPRPDGLLQVGQGGVVSTEQITGALQSRACAAHTLHPPRTTQDSSLPMLLTHTDSSSHFLLFHIKRSLFTLPFSSLPQAPCTVIIIPRVLTSRISTDIS